MGHPVVKHRPAPLRIIASPPAAPVQRTAPTPRLLPMLLPILVFGGIAMLHVVSLARLSELEAESRRLERLSLEQTMRRGELMRQRAKLTNTTVLFEYATKRGMVPATHMEPIRVGVLPAGKVYWALPGETRPAPTSGFPATGQVGQLLPVDHAERQRL
ncbi:MAG: hypothetical protein ACYC63_14455 [Armatimonadota bacterium]